MLKREDPCARNFSESETNVTNAVRQRVSPGRSLSLFCSSRGTVGEKVKNALRNARNAFSRGERLTAIRKCK